MNRCRQGILRHRQGPTWSDKFRRIAKDRWDVGVHHSVLVGELEGTRQHSQPLVGVLVRCCCRQGSLRCCQGPTVILSGSRRFLFIQHADHQRILL